MKEIINCQQMKKADICTIQEMEIPSLVLMERASLAVAEEMAARGALSGRILVVCGSGNNGGDGVATARILHNRGVSVYLYFPGNPSKFSEETERQLRIAGHYQVPVMNNPNWDEYTTIVDAMFGIGLSREVTGAYAKVIRNMNASSATVWAVDIPSGVNGDTGQIMGCAVRADVTVTFAYGKMGHYLYPGKDFCGETLVKDIGIYRRDKTGGLCSYMPDKEDLRNLPPRCAWGNKGTIGKELVVAGSHNMYGAAYLSGKAVLAAGAGMVKIHTADTGRVILQQLLPEALLSTDEDEWDTAKWSENLHWCDAVVLGPGLGQDARAENLVEFYARQEEKPVIIDADGLNILSTMPNILRERKTPAILTPHVGEMGRLTGRTVEELKQDLPGEARLFAENMQVVCVLKDAVTVTASSEGNLYLNPSGNDGMATAGSGDVLSGVIGSLLAQGADVEKAAYLGVYLHGLAGDAAAGLLGRRSMTAVSIIDGLSEVLLGCQDGGKYGKIQ